MKNTNDNKILLQSSFEGKRVKIQNIEHFIFDFGGIMVEKTYVLDNLFSIINSDFHTNIPNKKDSPYIRKLRRAVGSGRISSRDFLEAIFNKYIHDNNRNYQNLNQPNIDYYLELWFHHYTQLTNFSPEMQEVVSRLKRSGYVVSLMSNTYEIHAKSNELRGFYDLFDNIFLSNEIGFRKPNIKKYVYVLNELNAKPESCVFIDDKLINLIPAKQLGISVIKFDNITSFKKKLYRLLSEGNSA